MARGPKKQTAYISHPLPNSGKYVQIGSKEHQRLENQGAFLNGARATLNSASVSASCYNLRTRGVREIASRKPCYLKHSFIAANESLPHEYLLQNLPNKLEKPVIIAVVKDLLDWCEHMHGGMQFKMAATIEIFRCLAANSQFVVDHPRFAITAYEKMLEFSRDPNFRGYAKTFLQACFADGSASLAAAETGRQLREAALKPMKLKKSKNPAASSTEASTSTELLAPETSTLEQFTLEPSTLEPSTLEPALKPPTLEASIPEIMTSESNPLLSS